MLEKELKNYISYCQEWEERLKDEKAKQGKGDEFELPACHLEIHNRGGQPQYYLSYADPETKTKKRRYVKHSDLAMAMQIAQKDYLASVSKAMETNLYWARGLYHSLKNGNLEGLYQQLSPHRKNLVQPILPSWQERLKNWMEEPFEPSDYHTDRLIFETNRGEKVRSKSEKIIADIFDHYQLPYKYERPLKLRDGNIYPDFTLYDPNEDQEVYWEHFGRMDDSAYCNNILSRIFRYAKNGIVPGRHLLFTFESSAWPLDVEMIRTMALQLCPFKEAMEKDDRSE